MDPSNGGSSAESREAILRDITGNANSDFAAGFKPPATLVGVAGRLAAQSASSQPTSANCSTQLSASLDARVSLYSTPTDAPLAPPLFASVEGSGSYPPGAFGAASSNAAAAAAAAARAASSPGRTDRADPAMVGEYQSDIVAYLMERERTLHRDASYLTRQPEITERMRVILVDWLVDVHLKFKLHAETFFLAVDIVDRYLMVAQGQRATLQLVGITATLLAAKHEEIYPPEIKDCEYISADTYKRPQILQMERDITAALNFRLTVPTPYPILCRLLEVASEAAASQSVRFAAQFFLETAAMDYGMLAFLPSRIAIAALVLGLITAELNVNQRVVTIHDIWDREFNFYAQGVTLDEVLPCAEAMLSFTKNITAANSKYQATKRKFRSSRFLGVANYTLPEGVVAM